MVNGPYINVSLHQCQFMALSGPPASSNDRFAHPACQTTSPCGACKGEADGGVARRCAARRSIGTSNFFHSGSERQRAFFPTAFVDRGLSSTK
jgi:hypothetical protein